MNCFRENNIVSLKTIKHCFWKKFTFKIFKSLVKLLVQMGDNLSSKLWREQLTSLQIKILTCLNEIKFLPKIRHIMVVENQWNIISLLSLMFKKCLIIVISIKKTSFQNHNGSECSGTGWYEQACPVINIVSIAACSSKNFFNSPYWAIVPHNYSAHSLNPCRFQPKITYTGSVWSVRVRNFLLSQQQL